MLRLDALAECAFQIAFHPGIERLWQTRQETGAHERAAVNRQRTACTDFSSIEAQGVFIQICAYTKLAIGRERRRKAPGAPARHAAGGDEQRRNQDKCEVAFLDVEQIAADGCARLAPEENRRGAP